MVWGDGYASLIGKSLYSRIAVRSRSTTVPLYTQRTGKWKIGSLPVPKIKVKASGMLLPSCKGARGFSVVLHEVEWRHGVSACSRQVKRSRVLRRNFGSTLLQP